MGNPQDNSPTEKDVSPGAFDEANGEMVAANTALKAVEAGRAEDVDIAAQILAQYGTEFDRTWTPEEEKRLIRKVDWMIVPIVSSTSLD